MSLAFQPFHETLRDSRLVRIPSELDGDARTKLIAKLIAAVQQQRKLASSTRHVLQITGDPVEQADGLLIPHEPARVLNAEMFEGGDRPSIDDLLWLTWALNDALLSATGQRIIHGGIQAGAVYQDETGRAKLGDFGIAAAFEAVLGTDARRQLCCEVDASDGAEGAWSGVWAMLDEDESRDFGWLAPYFGPELLEGKLRLNPKSDQFALGALLFMLGAGAHPYGAALSDPTLMFYLTLDPSGVRDERRDWKDVFERLDQGLSGPKDAPILTWSDVLARMLASDPGKRFENPEEINKTLAGVVPEDYSRSADALTAASQALERGEVESCLKHVATARESAGLPALWRSPLDQWADVLEARKDVLGRARKLRQQVQDAQRALDQLDLETAERLAAEVQDAPEAEEAAREAAREIVEACQEQRQMIESGADSVAEAYLQSAAEMIERGELSPAREILDGMLADPATPPSRAAQARERLNAIDVIEQRTQEQVAALEEATQAVRTGDYKSAREQLDNLRTDAELPEALLAQVEFLTKEIEAALARRAEFAGALESARTAWNAADAEMLRSFLERVPIDVRDPEIARPRRELEESLHRLERILAGVAAVEAAVEAGDPARALELGAAAPPTEDLPPGIQTRLEAALSSAETSLAKQREAAVAAALAALERARTAFVTLDAAGCRALIDKEVLPESALPRAERETAESLLRECGRLDAALGALELARDQLSRQSFDEAEASLGGVDLEGLPEAYNERFEALVAEADRQRSAHASIAREALRKRLAEAEQGIASGKLKPAAAALREVTDSSFADDALRAEAERLQKLHEQQTAIARALDQVEAALADENANLDSALAAIQRLGDLPEWADQRARTLIARADKIAEERRKRQLQSARQALEQAAELLAAGQVETARKALESAKAGCEQDARLRERYETIARDLTAIEKWTPKIVAVEQKAADDVVAARSAASRLLKDGELPAALQTRLKQIVATADQAIGARHGELDATLQALSEELDRRGRRVRDFFDRLAKIEAEPLANDVHRRRAAELRKKFEALPEPTSRTPLILAGVVGGVAVIAAAVMIPRMFGSTKPQPTPPDPTPNMVDSDPVTPDPQPEPPPPDVPALARTALEAARPRLAALREQARRAGREAPEWTLAFQPADALPTRLIATRGGADAVTLTEIATVADFTAIDLSRLPDSSTWDRLFPAPPPPPDLSALAATFAGQVQSASPAGVENVRVATGDTATGALRVQAEYRGRSLIAFDNLSADAAAGTFSAAPDAVAAHFARQIEALALVESRPEGWLSLDPQYDAAITTVDHSAEITGVNTGGIMVRVGARLRGDERTDASFALSGQVANGRLTADAATGPVFERYLGEIQQLRLTSAAAEVSEAATLPTGVTITPGEFSGTSGALRISLGSQPLGELSGEWTPADLSFRFPPERVGGLIADGLRTLAGTPAAAEHLRDRWEVLRDEIKPGEGEPGANVFSRATLVRPRRVEDRLDAASLTVGFALELEVPHTGEFLLPIDAMLGPDGFEFIGVDAARQAVRDAMARESASAELRSERAAAALAATVGELNVNVQAANSEQEGDRLLVRVPDAEGERRFEWSWSPGDLDWTSRRELDRITRTPEPAPEPEPEPDPTPTPVVTLDDRLDQLASETNITLDQAAQALADITRTKLERFGAPGYTLMSAAQGAGGLRAVSDRWTRELGGDPAPRVFVEYYVGQRNVYALAWRSGDARALLWSVMPTTQLRTYGSGARLRSAFEGDARLGEALLGKALGDSLQGAGGGYGVVIAPDDVLWNLRWSRVAFNARPHREIDLEGVPVAGTVNTLGPLIEGALVGRDPAYAKARLWCAPTLAATWTGDLRRVPTLNFTLGSRGPVRVGFPPSDRLRPLRVAALADDAAPGRSAHFDNLTRDDLGNKFWSVERDGVTWLSAPVVTFAVLPTGD